MMERGLRGILNTLADVSLTEEESRCIALLAYRFDLEVGDADDKAIPPGYGIIRPSK